MPADIREYLTERFRTDAGTLRQRAAALQGASRPAPGPDAALSRAMADACDAVAALAETLPDEASVDDMVAALLRMLPELARRADDPALRSTPAVRSVYIGAATRVKELIAAESGRPAAGTGNGVHDDGDDDDFEQSDEDVQ